MDRSPKNRAPRNDSFPAEAAIAALGFLADDPERLERFLALSGLGPHNLRRDANRRCRTIRIPSCRNGDRRNPGSA